MDSGNFTAAPSDEWIRYYFLYLVTVIGCFSNIIAISVLLLSKSMRTTPSGVLLLSLTITDTIVLTAERTVTLTHRNLGSHQIYMDENTLILMYYLKYSGRCAASFIIACISVNRFAVIVFPLKSHWFLSTKNAIKQVISGVFLVLLLNIYIFVWPPLENSKQNVGYFYCQVVIEIILADIIVSILILTLCLMTVNSLIKSRHGFEEASISDVQSDRRTRQVTVLLLVVAFMYVILRWQYKLTWIPLYFISLSDSEPPQGLRTAYYITYSVYLMNHAINLYQYCLCSGQFRAELSRIFCTIRCRKVEKNQMSKEDKRSKGPSSNETSL